MFGALAQIKAVAPNYVSSHWIFNNHHHLQKKKKLIFLRIVVDEAVQIIDFY